MNLGSLPRALQCLCLVFAAGGMPAYGQDTTAVGCDLSEMGASDPAYIGSTIGSGSSHIDLGADLDRFEDAETAWHVVWTTNDALAVEWSAPRSEEHTSALQSPMRISYSVFCLKKKKNEQ